MSNQRADATTVVQLGAAESFIGVNYGKVGKGLHTGTQASQRQLDH